MGVRVVDIMLRKLIELVRGRVSLFFGEAGVGKTNVVLWLLSVLSRERPDLRFIYICTEGSAYMPVVGRYQYSENTLFATAYSGSDLFRIVAEIYVKYGSELGMVVIDSVNNFYRADATLVPNANKLLNSTLSLLVDSVVRRGLTCLLTAQVSASDEEVGISGIPLLRYWCDNIIKLTRVRGVVRELTLEYPKNIDLTLRYTIDGSGVRWISNE